MNTTVHATRAPTAREQLRLHVLAAISTALIQDHVLPDDRLSVPAFVPCNPDPDSPHWDPVSILTPAGKGRGGTLRKGREPRPHPLVGARGLPVHAPGHPAHLLDTVLAARLLALEGYSGLEEKGQDKLEKLKRHATLAPVGAPAARGRPHEYLVQVSALEVLTPHTRFTVPAQTLVLSLDRHRPRYRYARVTRHHVKGAWVLLKAREKPSPWTRTERTSTGAWGGELGDAYAALLDAREKPVNWLRSRSKYQRNPATGKKEAAAWETLLDYALPGVRIEETPRPAWEHALDRAFDRLALRTPRRPAPRSRPPCVLHDVPLSSC